MRYHPLTVVITGSFFVLAGCGSQKHEPERGLGAPNIAKSAERFTKVTPPRYLLIVKDAAGHVVDQRSSDILPRALGGNISLLALAGQSSPVYSDTLLQKGKPQPPQAGFQPQNGDQQPQVNDQPPQMNGQQPQVAYQPPPKGDQQPQINYQPSQTNEQQPQISYNPPTQISYTSTQQASDQQSEQCGYQPPRYWSYSGAGSYVFGVPVIWRPGFLVAYNPFETSIPWLGGGFSISIFRRSFLVPFVNAPGFVSTPSYFASLPRFYYGY